MKPPKLPEEGTDVAITWVDSGMDVRGKASDPHSLLVSRCLGTLVGVESSKQIHDKVCTRRKCFCETAVVAMCSAGDDDDHASLGLIWVNSIVRVEVLE